MHDNVLCHAPNWKRRVKGTDRGPRSHFSMRPQTSPPTNPKRRLCGMSPRGLISGASLYFSVVALLRDHPQVLSDSCGTIHDKIEATGAMVAAALAALCAGLQFGLCPGSAR
jgi:hypothetical protein